MIFQIAYPHPAFFLQMTSCLLYRKVHSKTDQEALQQYLEICSIVE